MLIREQKCCRGLQSASIRHAHINNEYHYGICGEFAFNPLLSYVLLSSEDEDFSNELPSSSLSLPSSPSLASSSPASSDLPHSSPSLPHPEPALNPAGNLRLEIAAPHYHNDQLQVKVFWKWPSHGESIHWRWDKEVILLIRGQHSH